MQNISCGKSEPNIRKEDELFFQKRKKTFCAVYQKSSSGIQRIEFFRSRDAEFSKLVFERILVLTECISVRELPVGEQSGDEYSDRCVLQIFTKQLQLELGTDSIEEMTVYLIDILFL